MLCVTLTGIGRGHGQNKRYVKKYVQICDVCDLDWNRQISLSFRVHVLYISKASFAIAQYHVK